MGRKPDLSASRRDLLAWLDGPGGERVVRVYVLAMPPGMSRLLRDGWYVDTMGAQVTEYERRRVRLVELRGSHDTRYILLSGGDKDRSG